jgi:hypothetical protein
MDKFLTLAIKLLSFLEKFIPAFLVFWASEEKRKSGNLEIRLENEKTKREIETNERSIDDKYRKMDRRSILNALLFRRVKSGDGDKSK